jgi:hypothetical protein
VASSDTPRDAHYIGGVRTLLLEAAKTNDVLHNRDLTNAVWVKTNVTAVKDQTGIDNVANSASRITASAANGTCLQAVTSANTRHAQTAFVKRLVGSGTIQMTMDNGTTWTNVTVTAGWTRVSIPWQSLVNPTVGFRIVTNGDSIAVDFVQNEWTMNYTSPIETGAAAVTRAMDSLSFPYTHAPQTASMYLDVADLEESSSVFPVWLALGHASIFPVSGIPLAGDGGAYYARHDNGIGEVTSITAYAHARFDRIELLHTLSASGEVQITRSINGGADTSGALSGALAFGSFAEAKLFLRADAACFAIRGVKILRGVKTMAEMRAA